MNETNWKPTEEILVSLGFERRPSIDVTFSLKLSYNEIEESYVELYVYLDEGDVLFHIIDGDDGSCIVPYPKSLEELRTLIAMMRP